MEFKPKQDWNFQRMIWKGDEWIRSQAYDNAHTSMLEYLGIDDEEQLTRELIGEAQQLIQHLEQKIMTEADQSSPTYYGYQRVVQDWEENFEEEEG